MFGASDVLTTDEWHFLGETIRVEFRTTATSVDVTVRSSWPGDSEEATRFPTVGAAERWYAQFSRALRRMGVERRGRTVVESFGSSDNSRGRAFGGRGPHATPFGPRGGPSGAATSRPGAGAPTVAHPRVSEAYAMLGVRPGVREPDLRAAYRRLALEWHPDRCDHPAAPARMGAINRAYDQVRRNEGIAS